MSHDAPRFAAINRARMHKVLAVPFATMSELDRSGDLRDDD